ncbi:LuxR C-terminal-related transcriptional regulator [Bradyrhizobium huanghuaihaiense]|uniref:LuxR C-terminal-related transcriptional regulator n=1 Tax=Bradyrhizobium huanghuaihaiense TaxID=990078 RepID=UPI0021AA28A3|nr:LuxR C-terminal-related transcriptional regulator [Bradyrhizobium sp. CB3035]UWU80602.1 LuxR C-terminal-related transcriptional regulator [Bradyrhizobium sp. CB3035]
MLDIAKQGIFQRIRLVIADRQPIVLQGLKSVFAAQQDFDVVASSSDGTSCLEAIRKLTPDVALVADTLPDLTVSKIIAIAKAEKLSTRLVFFTESDTYDELTAAIAAGTCSAISKYASPATMLRSLRLMTKSGVSLEQSDLSPTGKEVDGGKIEKMLEHLTHRERQIVRLVSEGMSNKEIARQLDVSHGTVKVHLYNIFQKLEITNRTVLATIALLQRASGFGALSLALLVIAIADELKASEANDVLPDDDGIGHAGEHAEYEPWKKAILRHRIAWESGETPPVTQRDVLAKVSQVADPAAAMEALHAAEQSAGSKPSKDHGPVGSSTPNLPALLPRGNVQMGGDPAPDHLVPRLASNPMSLQGGYGTFATLAGALIDALHDPHLGAQSHDPGKASLDGFVSFIRESATTKLADAGARHVDNSAPASHESQPSSAFVSTGNESVAGEGGGGQIGHGAAGDGAGADLQKLLGLLNLGQDADLGGDGRDQLMGGNVENVASRSPVDSHSTSSDAAFDFGSGSSRINLAAFGALAWLHMTAASKSIPPHTLAWIYDPASNETIVYVNPTDRSLDIGDRGLVEIHLQGIVSVAEQDFVGHPEGAAVAITLEQLEAALTSAAATDESVLSTDNVHAIGGAGESTVETAGWWNIRADDGLRFQFGQTRTGLGASTRSRSVASDSADATEESDGASAASAHASSIVLAHSVKVTAVENPTLKSEPINAGTGDSSGLNEIVQPSVATADSAGRGNSEHASEQGAEKAAARESAEDDSKPGNGVGNDKKTAEAAEENHGNSDHSNSAKAPAAETTEADTEPGNGAGNDKKTAETAEEKHGNADHSNSAKAPAAETTEADTKPGNGAGNDKKTAETAEEKHGNADHSNSAKAPAAETTEADSKPGNGAGNDKKTAETAEEKHGNSDHSNSAKAAAAETTEADTKPGNGAGNDKKTAETAEEKHANSEHSNSAKAVAAETTEADTKPGDGVGNDKKTAEAADEQHGNSGHDLHPASANGPQAADVVDPVVATDDSASHGNSDHASKPGSATADATELAEADSKPGNGVGNDKKTAEAADVDHGNSGHDLHPASANGPQAAGIVEPVVATVDSASHGNSDHASKPGSATADATELAEADSTPGNGGGNDKKTAEAADEQHGNSGHDLHPASANGPQAADVVDPVVATDDSASHGNSDHASKPGSATADATELAEADSKPGNGVGNDKKTAEAADVDHGNSGHDLHPASANGPQAAGIVEPVVATVDSASHGNSDHASKPGSATADATELAEADSTPGNGGGNDKKTAEAADVDHGNSGHDLHPASANGPQAAEIVEAVVATDDGASHGNSDHASKPGSATADATELAEADSAPSNGGGNDKKTAEAAVVEHGNSGHDSQSTSANAPDAAGTVEPSVASGDDAGHGNAQQVMQFAAIASEAAQPAQAAPETGSANLDLVFRFDSAAASSTPVAVVVPQVLDTLLDVHVPPGQQKALETILHITSSALDDHAPNHGNSGLHPANGHAAHDLLI